MFGKTRLQVFTGAIMGDGDKGVGSIDEIPACVMGDPIGGSGGGGIMVPPALPYMLEPGFKETPAISFVLLPREKSSKITSTYFVLCPTVHFTCEAISFALKAKSTEPACMANLTITVTLVQSLGRVSPIR
jgi:hypothetical protein